MKAIVFSEYGLPDVVQLKEVDKPVPGDKDVLIKIRAASVNLADWELLTGRPYIGRLVSGIFRPKTGTLGADFAGQVEAVGSKVKQYKPGDEVVCDDFGRWGGFAEYACARENKLALKPAGMSYEEAAAYPTAAVLALFGFRGRRKVQPGQKILINGAGGGFGTFAVQMAKSYGAEVTCVDSAEKLDLLRSLGADHVIDYTREDFTRNGQQYDLILDAVGYRSMFDYKRALSPGGQYIMVGGSDSAILRGVFVGLWISITSNKKVGIILGVPNLARDMAILEDLYKSGKVVPVIDRTYSLSEVPEALRYIGEGHVKGKVIINMEQI